MDDAERKIDEMNAEMQACFLKEFGDPAELLAPSQQGSGRKVTSFGPGVTTFCGLPSSSSGPGMLGIVTPYERDQAPPRAEARGDKGLQAQM